MTRHRGLADSNSPARAFMFWFGLTPGQAAMLQRIYEGTPIRARSTAKNHAHYIRQALNPGGLVTEAGAYTLSLDGCAECDQARDEFSKARTAA